MIIIQTFQEASADFSQTIDLDGTPYTIRCTWNTREETWYMDLIDKRIQPILLGIKLVPNYLLTNYYSMQGLPPGDFYLWDSENKPQNFPLTFDNLGSRYILIYFTKEELDAL